MLSEQRSQLTGLAVAIALVAVVTGVIFGLREAVPVVSTGVVYLLPVLIVSIYWGVWMGLATSLLSAAAFNFFHLPPTGNFTISDGENWVALAVFFTIAVIASTLADAARNRQIEAELRRREADLVAEMARVMLSGESLEDSLREAGQRIASAYDLPAVTVSLEWVASEQRMVALPLLVQGERAGTLSDPRDTPEDVAETIRVRIVPALEALVGAARRRSELEAQVVETRALRHSNVLKTTMLRSVSHDLRSPLTAISAAAGGLQSDTLSDEERRELTAVISTEAARLARLVDNVLDLSRLQAGAAAPRTDWCSIEEVVREAVASVTAPPKGFDISLDDDLPLIRADAAQLERALANVLENAARHAGESPVTIRASAPVNRLLLRVSDAGSGIPKEELERVFEPFHRSDRPGPGSGLGLAIARGFVELNGGRLRADSLPGRAATFLFDLPLATDESEPSSLPPAARRSSG